MSAAELLATMAQLAQVFHAPDGKCYATIPVNRHEETWPVRSKRFRGWLQRAYYRDQNKPAPSQAMAETLGLVEARALDGPEQPVHVRVAEHEGRIYVDLADHEWRAVEVDSTGWRVVPRAPVKFHRASGMLALPEPQTGGTLGTLRRFLNVEDENTWRLVVHWLVMALHPHGPYPVLALHGEQGAAKSTATRVLRELVDPNAAPLRSEPREPRDLMIAASHGWVIALDNLSHLPAWLSDALCRLSTGGGFSTRELYSDDEEVIFSAKRPVILNGIEEVITRGDLMQRSLLVELPAITPGKRMEEGAFWQRFAQEWPSLFGALLSAVAAALREAPAVRLPALPRMADFARWSVAAERGLGWTPGGFMSTYNQNIAGAHELVLDGSPVAHAVRALVADCAWSGTASELLETLARRVDEPTRRVKGWPTTARTLSGTLRRLAPNLRAVGVEVTFDREPDKGRRRTIRLEPVKAGNPPSEPSAASETPKDGAPASDAADALDAADARIPALTGRGRPSATETRDLWRVEEGEV